MVTLERLATAKAVYGPKAAEGYSSLNVRLLG